MFSNITMAYMKRNKFIIENGAHDTDVLIIVLSGSFSMQLNTGERVVEKNSCVFFRKGQTFKRKTIEPIEILYITFYIRDHTYFPECTRPLNLPVERIQQNLNLLKGDSKNIKHVVTDLILNDFYHLKGEESSTVNKITDYIKAHLIDEIVLKDLADKFHLSPSGLIYVFKKFLGTTPKEYVINLRLEKSVQLLLNTDMPISKISDLCGYQNPYYFSNAFKKAKALSPTEYRKKYTV